MKFGFAKTDITPRVGVELCGFGAYILRKSIGVRDRLWARAMAAERDGKRAVLVSCDLVGITLALTRQTRRIVGEATGLADDAIMIHCTHTHSGPGIGAYTGWGEADQPYLELLPGRIAKACREALANLQEATLSHAVAPCEGVGYNREYDKTPPFPGALDEKWRPEKPELTDTTCHVMRVDAGGPSTMLRAAMSSSNGGKTIGFLSYFGCHPVVCCAETRHIHGDYCGVATNLLEREHPGSVGLFLQGAQGDVNSCVVHKPELESLQALDVIASRYARAVRAGLHAAKPVDVNALAFCRREVTFTRKPWDRKKLCELLVAEEAIIHAPEATEADQKVRLAVVRATALRRMIATLDAGGSLQPPTEIHGMRLGQEISLLGAPFEIFQAIKNDVLRQAKSPIPLVMGLTNDSIGYAPDCLKAAQGGYAADLVPLICGSLPFANVHEELVKALLDLDAAL